ncbi:hypothetical protein KEM60_03190 [Austwickia sp. TVS 96-490-7B]|uniref:ABC transporter substrate-binding protein n=1 Tax=Austwickia sp. TVS 96-490-7B TaxID=2830843 RepID=UPI001D829E3E|nr:extracellular solute-binding protein [Austwickia sp. TVS 96-490-7B]MBW3086961.1 hypothetical protein [Austwickia sp. TVS 96-490-7B]
MTTPHRRIPGPAMSSTPPPLWDRRAVLAGGAALVGGFLAGCGANTGRDGGAGGAPARTASATGPNLSQWYHQYGEAGTLDAVRRYAADFKDAQISITWKPGDYDNAVAAALQTDSAPDVFEYANGPTADMIVAGQVADLTDLIGPARTDLDPALLKRFTFQGKIWAIPQVIDLQVLVYRRSMLDKAEVLPPRTMDELVAAVDKLGTDKVKGLFLGNDGGAGLMGAPMLRSCGADLLTPDGKIAFDRPAAVSALAVLHRWYADRKVLLGAPNDWFSPDAFTQGLTAMQFTGMWTLPQISKDIGDDFGVLPWPAMPGGKAHVPVGAYGACLRAKGAHLDVAKKYAAWLWLDSVDRQVEFATAYGLHVPARAAAVDKAERLRDGPAGEAVRLLRQYGVPQDHILWTPACQSAFHDMMVRVVNKGADPAAELAALKGPVAAELRRFPS